MSRLKIARRIRRGFGAGGHEPHGDKLYVLALSVAGMVLCGLVLVLVAGLTRVEFLEMCGRYRVSIFNYPPEELAAEMRADLQAVAGPHG